MQTSTRVLALAGLALLGSLPAQADAQWTITMRAMRNPLPLGECTAVEIVVMDASGRQSPMRPDGKPVSGWDFDFSVTSTAPDAFRLQNDDVTRPFICAQAATAASATFTAHYPGRQLQPNQVVPGMELWKSVEVVMQGAAGPGYAAGGAPGGYPSGGYPAATPGGAAPTGYHPSDPAPSTASPSQPSGYPQQPGGYPQQPQPAYPQQPQPAYPQQPQPAYPQQPQPAYPQQPQPGYPQQPTGYQQPVQTAAAPAPAEPEPPVRTGKQFLQRITGKAKRKASEVAQNTTTHVADAAGDVVGTTLEAGSDVVKSNAGAVTGAAGKQVQGVGQALGAGSSPKDPADVAAALAAGRAVFSGLKFAEGTAMLDPSSAPLISQIAGALVRTPGQFLIEAHVDGKNGAAAQALSEQRAAAVKAALVAAGSPPMQLAAVGYGASRPIAGARSSARVEIVRTQ